MVDFYEAADLSLSMLLYCITESRRKIHGDFFNFTLADDSD